MKREEVTTLMPLPAAHTISKVVWPFCRRYFTRLTSTIRCTFVKVTFSGCRTRKTVEYFESVKDFECHYDYTRKNVLLSVDVSTGAAIAD